MSELRGRRRADGAHTRESILRLAADLASIEGLDRLTIGSLAGRLGMSKSGLFAHFGSKEELQLATIDAARRRFAAVVLNPALEAPRGIARLRTLCETEIDYFAKPEFPGGCFFCMARAEFHMRPGPVRDAIMENKRYWRQLLTSVAGEARERNEIDASTDLDQLVFELEAVMDAVTWSVGDDRKEEEIQRARRAVSSLLERASTDPRAPVGRRAIKREARPNGR